MATLASNLCHAGGRGAELGVCWFNGWGIASGGQEEGALGWIWQDHGSRAGLLAHHEEWCHHESAIGIGIQVL
eukprot:2374403-Ditylum_brightwellii.AAC.1